MPTNPYFQNGSQQEQDLYESLVIEAIKIYGQDCFYIPRKIVKRDLIINEDLISAFEKAYKIEMYVESVDGFEGDGQLLSKFGLEIRDSVNLVVSNLRWNQLIGQHGYSENSARPLEGDLIYFPLTKGLFEIKFVEDKKPFAQLQDFPIFKLSCELFEYESQEIDTGIREVDKIQAEAGDSQILEYTNNDSPEQLLQEFETLSFTLPSGVTGSCEFFKYSTTTDSPQLQRIHVSPPTFNDGKYHTLVTGTVLTGQTSGASVTASNINQISDGTASDDELFGNDHGAQNSTFSQHVNVGDFLDFSEENPFGEPFNF
tara:strand:- start:197 stop:1141 length:945 start_codon:yes stop_codon:yes gene_type:complete